MKRYIQQRWTGNPRTSWWSPLDTDVFCRLPLPTLLYRYYRHMFCCDCCDLWCVCVICLVVKIVPHILSCCRMSCCLTSRGGSGTMDWLSQNDSKQSITYNQVHSKRQKLLTINSFKQINWYKGITIHHQINELLTHSHGQVGWSGRFEARMMDSDGHDTTWSSELNTSF